MNKIKVGVIGLGMGSSHIKSFSTHPQVEVVAVADSNKARLDERGNQHNIKKLYLSAEEMLKNQARKE